MRLAILILSAGLLSSCASTIGPIVKARLAPAGVESPVLCDVCKTEWERSQLWLLAHSKWKLQMATDVVLQTFNPIEYDVSFGFQVTKSPKAGGYQIVMAAICGNPLGCEPEAADVRRAFYHYVRTGDDLLLGAGYLGAIR